MRCTPKVGGKAAGTGGPWTTHFTHSREMAKPELECSVFFLHTWHTPHLTCKAEKAQKILARLFVFENTP